MKQLLITLLVGISTLSPQIDDVTMVFQASSAGIHYMAKVTYLDGNFKSFSPVHDKSGLDIHIVKNAKGSIEKIELFLLDQETPFQTERILKNADCIIITVKI